MKQSARKLSDVVKPEGMTVEAWQVALRRQAAREERFLMSCVNDRLLPGEYRVKNPKSRQTYKVVYRGAESPWNYCSCLDFKTSRLGTCKHLEATRLWLENHPTLKVHTQLPPYTSVYLSYRQGRKVCIRIGSDRSEEFRRLAAAYFDGEGHLRPEAYQTFPRFLDEAHRISDTFRCYSDALDFVIEQRDAVMRRGLLEECTDSKLDSLLSVPLFAYQKEGVRFAVEKGRVILADEMGLGKTLQAIATCEVLRRGDLLGSVLVVCPTSLKYQWKSEIERFTGAEVCLVEGTGQRRKELYLSDALYKIVSYNAMANDVKSLGLLQSDMLILDEVQRLKNWNTQIAIAARRVEARYVVALSGTPLENRLEELFSVMELVDQYCLGPYYRFRQQCIVTNESGKVTGYQHLHEVGRLARQRLIRRRKRDVELQMPHRQDKNLLVPMTTQQMEKHEEFKQVVARLIHKWNSRHFLSEQDRRQLLLNLNQMRMVSDSTYVLDQKTRYDVKVDEAMNIIAEALQDEELKVVVFSQWERMARLLATELEQRGIGMEYLYGGVPAARRGAICRRFQEDPACRVFVSTDAGSTGLNLQRASLVINLDLPWNPAVLEQRIGRIYRIGQTRSVQVVNLVSKDTIEERMVRKLRFKQEMLEGVLDGGEDTIFVSEEKFQEMMSDLDAMLSTDEGVKLPATIEVDEIEHDDAPPLLESEKEPQPAAEAPKPAEAPPADEAHQLLGQGVAFFSGLAKTLQSPEATERLVEALVKRDEQTGGNVVQIPVPDKESVRSVLNFIGKLLK